MPKESWTNTIYFLWWSYLKLNQEYIACCDSGGHGMLANLYADFGDVRGDSFERWWKEDERGVRLFANRRTLSTLSVIDERTPVSCDQSTISVLVPLDLPKQLILDEFKKILNEHHLGKRGHQIAKASNAKYRFNGQPNIRALHTALAIYKYRKQHPTLTLWEIGNEMEGFRPRNKLLESDDKAVLKAKKNRLSALVNRYLRQANEAIEATGDGQFPRK